MRERERERERERAMSQSTQQTQNEMDPNRNQLAPRVNAYGDGDRIYIEMKRTLRSCDAFRAKDDYYYGKINEFRQLNLIDQTNWVMNGQFTENRQIYQLLHSYITENKIVSPSFNYLGVQEGQLLMPDFHNWVQYWIDALYQAKNMVHAKVVKYGELTSKTFNEIRRADYAMFRHMMKCRVGIERGNNNEDNSELTELKQETENTLGDKLAALNDSTITQFSTLEENQNADLGNDNVITGVDNLNIIVNRENYISNNNNNENNDNTVPPTGSDSARISENNEENDTTHEEIDDAANLHQTIAELRAQLAVAHRRNENLERAAEEDARNPLQLSNNTNDERFEKLFGILNKRNEEEFELRRQQMEIEKLKLIRMAELEEKRQDESKENISKEKEEIKRFRILSTHGRMAQGTGGKSIEEENHKRSTTTSRRRSQHGQGKQDTTRHRQAIWF